MPKAILSQAYLKTLFYYNPETGVLTWRNRPRDHFKTRRAFNIWNTRFSGKEAGSDNGQGYLVAKINNTNYIAHRVIWCLETGAWPKDQLDHIDHDRMNNKFANLREATHQENLRNQTLDSRNTSGIAGVYWSTQNQKWRAQIRVNGKNKHLGYFDEKLLAIFSRWQSESLYGFHENHGKEKAL